jgi:FkbM family methyltransferase
MEINDILYYIFKNKSYAQHGEDLLVKSYFETKKNGFFVDIGAHHPFRFSNTYIFYKRKWRGINIDAKPGTKKLFDLFRPRDINLELGIASSEGSLRYYMFNEPALNGFSQDLSKLRDSDTDNGYHIIGTKDIPVFPLVKVLDDYLPANIEVDFLSVDVEGLDLDVLSSNDWNKYRPKLVVAEDLDLRLDKLGDSSICTFLYSVNYELVGKTLNSLVFKDRLS